MAYNTNEFFLCSYLSSEYILEVLSFKKELIEKYAYIYHDQDIYDEDFIDERGNSHSYGDLKPAHFHIYLKLFNYRKQDEVYRWFEKYKSHGNTFVEPVRSTTSVLKYLTHEDDASIGAGKHIYSREQIVSYNVDFDSVNYTNDSTSMILQDLLNGFSIETLVFKYGREFVYHIRDYDLICKIKFGLNIENYQRMLLNQNDDTYYLEDNFNFNDKNKGLPNNNNNN